jgi:hypothetical protein
MPVLWKRYKGKDMQVGTCEGVGAVLFERLNDERVGKVV